MIKIDYFVIDASLSEDHAMDAKVTEFPIEEGSTVTDNVRRQPRSLTIKGVVSDTPIGTVAQLRGGSNLLPSEEALVQLRILYETGDPVTIETGIETYERMVLEKLSIPCDATTGDALMFSATFKQITLVEVRRVFVRTAPIAAKKKKLGLLNGDPPNWVATDKQGRKIFVANQGPGMTPVYAREDGTPVSADEARSATQRQGKTTVKFTKSGEAVPVSPRDTQPFTAKQKKPAWAPTSRVK